MHDYFNLSVPDVIFDVSREGDLFFIPLTTISLTAKVLALVTVSGGINEESVLTYKQNISLPSIRWARFAEMAAVSPGATLSPNLAPSPHTTRVFRVANPVTINRFPCPKSKNTLPVFYSTSKSTFASTESPSAHNRRVSPRLVQAEGRIAVGREQKDIGLIPETPAHESDHEIEHPSGITPCEQDGEPSNYSHNNNSEE